jgi:hypothetical protein
VSYDILDVFEADAVTQRKSSATWVTECTHLEANDMSTVEDGRI